MTVKNIRKYIPHTVMINFALNAEPLDWRGPLKAEIYIEKGTLDFIASVDPIERRKDL